MSRRKVEVSYEFNTHEVLWHCVLEQYESTLEQEKVSFYVSVCILSFFTLEAYINHILKQYFPNIYEIEKEFFLSGEYIGSLGKINYVCNQLEIPIDKGARPYQTLSKLRKYRNFATHGKPEKEDDKLITERDRENGRIDSRIFQADKHFCKQVVKDIEAMCNLIQETLFEKYPNQEAYKKAFIGDIGIESGWV